MTEPKLLSAAALEGILIDSHLDAASREYRNVRRLASHISAQSAEIAKLKEALRLAAIRLGILTDQMRGCHEVTSQHELLDEAESFCADAETALAAPDGKKE